MRQRASWHRPQWGALWLFQTKDNQRTSRGELKGRMILVLILVLVPVLILELVPPHPRRSGGLFWVIL